MPELVGQHRQQVDPDELAVGNVSRTDEPAHSTRVVIDPNRVARSKAKEAGGEVGDAKIDIFENRSGHIDAGGGPRIDRVPCDCRDHLDADGINHCGRRSSH